MIPLYDNESLGKFPFWVIVIILINLYVFSNELIAPNSDVYIAQYALIPSLIDFNNLNSLYSFITHQFVHGGFLHIVSNMLFLWVFGRNVEAELSFFSFPALYLTSGILGGLAQYFIFPDSTLPMIGASGAIAGVLGAYFALFSGHTIKTFVPIFFFFTILDIPASIMLFYWFLTQVFHETFSLASTTATEGGIAYVAHIAGFICGWFLSKLIKPSIKI